MTGNILTAWVCFTPAIFGKLLTAGGVPDRVELAALLHG